MSKRFHLWTIIAILAGGAAVFIWLLRAHSDKARAEEYASNERPSTEQQLADAARKLHKLDAITPSALAPLELKRPVRLALGSLGLADDDQNGRLSDLILTDLSGAQGLNLVERQNLEKVLGELNLSWSGLVRANDAVRAGKLLKADWFLLGTGAKISGTNSIVIRVVDARTGILRDAGVFSSGKPLAHLAGDIAAFVRQSRQNAASAKSPVFLAIGAFEDLSVNNRQAGFPTQLHGYLTAAYQGGSVTLLEREYVETLLQEVRLDLAGLTEESAANAPVPMPSAYWLVSGSYQSFETTNLEVELTLDVERIFGLTQHITLRGVPGEPVSRKIKQAIDALMDQNPGIVVPTRNSEIRAQMAIGKELARLNPVIGNLALVSIDFERRYFDSNGNLDPREGVKRKRNLQEAIRAFEVVLLLDPGNREAKMYVAACLRSPIIHRPDDARQYYREIIDAEVQDEWSELARKALTASFANNFNGTADPVERVQWFKSAAQQNIHSSAKDFYSNQAKEAEIDATIAGGESSDVERLAEQRLFEALQSFKNVAQGKPGSYGFEMGMGGFAKTFGTDHAAAARRLVELLPKMRGQLPELEPYFLATIVTFQLDTNAPVIAEFQRTLAQISEHPNQVLAPALFWDHLKTGIYRWSIEHKLYGLAAQAMEGRLRAAAEGNPSLNINRLKNEDRIMLAFAYLGMENWQRARDMFESFSNQPIVMGNRGPWGPGLTTVLTGREAAFCAEKLGQTPARQAREFDMGKACFCLCTPSAFLLDESGLWIGISNQLLHLDFDLKTNLEVTLPKDSSTPVRCLCLTASTVWIATDGEGLFEYDKSSHQCRRWSEQDGLLMNNISCLSRAGNVLWIGHGHRTYGYWASGMTGQGGLGRLDLSTRQFESFTPPLEAGPKTEFEAGNKPTRRPVIVLAQGAAEDVWFVTEDFGTRLRHYRPRDKVWEAGPKFSSSLAVDQKRLFLGQYRNSFDQDKSGLLGVSILDFKAGKWRSLKAADGLPSCAVSALAPDGNDLWIGGKSYIALVDLEQDKVRKFARIQAQAVDQIQIGGGYIWAEYDSHLHRALLQNIR